MSFLDHITVVVINYNSEHIIAKSLEPLSSVAEIIIIDNASSKESVDYIRENFPECRLIENERNLGYGCGVNIGFKASKTKYTLVISPDSEINLEELTVLSAAAEQYEDAAVIAPSLIVPRIGREIWVMGADELGHRRADFDAAGPFCSWFVAGTVMFCPTERMLEIGGFDENIFLYMEDLDLAMRITEAGYSMIYIPEIEAKHLNSQSAPRSVKLHWLKDWNFSWGDLYVTEKHKGVTAARRKARNRCQYLQGRYVKGGFVER